MSLTIKSELIPIILFGLILAGLIISGIKGLPAPLPMLRLLLGLAYVLFVPGYTLQAALFPRKNELGRPERLALSFGLSIAVIAPIAVILDALPCGIRLWPIATAEGSFIAFCSLVTWCRRCRLPENERFLLTVEVDTKGWWDTPNRTSRILHSILTGAILTAVISATGIIILPKPGEHFTEFYILGPEGLAANYPHEAVVGQPITVTVCVTNQEGIPAEYRMAVMQETGVIGEAGPVHVEPGETYEGSISFALATAGDNVKVTFLLYRDGMKEPYRSLRLWLKVTD